MSIVRIFMRLDMQLENIDHFDILVVLPLLMIYAVHCMAWVLFFHVAVAMSVGYPSYPYLLCA